MKIDITLQNVYVGQKVRKGNHWSTQWSSSIFGIVLGYTDASGCLVGLNNKNENDLKTKIFWTLSDDVDKTIPLLSQPWKYNAHRSKSGDETTLGPAWCLVKWHNTDRMEILPIGATGPLSYWWTGEKRGYGKPCFSLTTNIF